MLQRRAPVGVPAFAIGGSQGEQGDQGETHREIREIGEEEIVFNSPNSLISLLSIFSPNSLISLF